MPDKVTPDFADADPGFHPYADIFPSMTEEEYDEFEEDIREHGLMVPIVTTKDGLILDGRHRYRACMAVGVKPKYQVHTGDPLHYVLSANLHRRHLNESQKAMVAARAANASVGHPPGKAIAGIPAIATDGKPLITQAQAGAMVGVHRDTVGMAKKVLEKGAPELVSLVDEGKVTVTRAAKVLKEDVDHQRAWVRDVRAGVVKPKLHNIGSHLTVVSDLAPDDARRPGGTVHSNVFRKKDAVGLSSMVNGMTLALAQITEVKGISKDQAIALDRDISKAKTVLNRIQKLLKEIN